MRRNVWWACALVLLATAGCGGSDAKPVTQADMEQTSLNDVAELYRVYQISKNKPPEKVADLASSEQIAPIGMNAIRTGDVIVRLGATLPDTGEAPGKGPDEVLAYQKQVPASGGKVLMLDRTIKTMTADEFKAAKLAGTSSSEKAPAKKK